MVNGVNEDDFRTGTAHISTCKSILVPRGCDPFGQRHGSRPLATSGRLQFVLVTDWSDTNTIKNRYPWGTCAKCGKLREGRFCENKYRASLGGAVRAQ